MREFVIKKGGGGGEDTFKEMFPLSTQMSGPAPFNQK